MSVYCKRIANVGLVILATPVIFTGFVLHTAIFGITCMTTPIIATIDYVTNGDLSFTQKMWDDVLNLPINIINYFCSNDEQQQNKPEENINQIL